jgi:hypothetical protein
MKAQIEWLTQRVENAPTSDHRKLPDMVALRVRIAWQKLKRQAVDGDEVWAFTTPSTTWKKQGKQTGYAIIRDGQVAQSVVVLRE